jgi:DNA-binding NarL/FixJ family response regulator
LGSLGTFIDVSVFAVSSSFVRVYVIERQPLLAKALCHVLSSIENVVIAGEAREFDAQAILRVRPEIVIADWDADHSILEDTLRTWRRALGGEIRICIMSRVRSAAVMMRAISAGADGYILKDVNPADLQACVRSLHQDGFYADHALTGTLLRNHFEDGTPRLSTRELEIARLVAQGMTNRQIAQHLALSDNTVKNHVANIFSKLNVTARTQIAVYVIRNGIA